MKLTMDEANLTVSDEKGFLFSINVGSKRSDFEHIIKCVNTHSELVEALEELVSAEWMVTHDWGGDREAVLNKASSLLAKAKL